MASLSTCHLGLWLGWKILLNLVKSCMSPVTIYILLLTPSQVTRSTD